MIISYSLLLQRLAELGFPLYSSKHISVSYWKVEAGLSNPQRLNDALFLKRNESYD